MKIIIAGGREVTDYDMLIAALMRSGYWKTYKKTIEVICGMALSWKWHENETIGGADRLGYRFAERNGLIIHEFHADWKTWGSRAGHIRNRDMGHFALGHEGRLLALHDGISSGTQGMIDFAKDNGLPGYVYRVDNPEKSYYIEYPPDDEA